MNFDSEEWSKLARYRISISNERRKNGEYDALNELTDAILKLIEENGSIFDKPKQRKSKKHKQRKLDKIK